MIKLALFFRRTELKLTLLALLALPDLAGAQFFQFNIKGDVLAGFRKTGANDTSGYEMVADLGSITNFLTLSAGTTITITNFTPGQLFDSFTNNNNLQWSVFSAFQGGGIGHTFWATPLGNFTNGTYWITVPAANTTTQTTPPPPVRSDYQTQTAQAPFMYAVGTSAGTISLNLSTENNDNTNTVVREPESGSYKQYDLAGNIADATTPSIGDFGNNGTALTANGSVYTVENTTPASFTTSQRDDFYQVVPSTAVDPITGLTGTTPYFVGYFILNSSGTMTFTRASLVSTPSAGTLSASITNGFNGLMVVFTNSSSSGSITNWVWNFGNGTTITNTTSGNVTNTYSATGSYTVTLTVYGSGGTNSYTVANYIVTSPTPKLGSLTVSSGKLIFSGANCPAGVQYRVLASTNVATTLANWVPVYTNTFANNGTFSFTNTISPTNSYFIMVSP